MPTTFEILAGIIAESCHVPLETITLDSDLLREIGIDSLDLLDAMFAIDEAFGVRVPIEQWLHAVHMKAPSAEHHFVMRELCARIDRMVLAAA